MQKRRIFILGAGISGLSLAHFLSHRNDILQIHILEKNRHAGGWIDSDDSSGFFFEKGPRVFRTSTSAAFLKLATEIGMDQEMIFSEAQGKYVWREGRLRSSPELSWELIKGVFKDWRTKPLTGQDESVWDFACRRFNPTVARTIFDPIVRGVYGGNLEEISIKNGFPRLKALEEQYGSVIRGFLKTPRSKGPRLFSFQRGMRSFVRKLEEQVLAQFHYDEEVTALQRQEGHWLIKTAKGSYIADDLFSALPCHILGKLLVPQLLQLSTRGTTLIQLGYNRQVLKKKGFGYLVASQEKDEVLGVVFDSNTFPQFNHSPQETRLTVMLQRDDVGEEEARNLALKALKRHLHIHDTPVVSLVMRAPQVFPQFKVGHDKLIQSIESHLLEKMPRLWLLGNYLVGPGVNDCIARAQSVAESFLREIAS